MGDWRFLDEWFGTLKGAVAIDDPSPWVIGNDTVRLGRDDDELWIEVRVHDGKASDAAQRKKRCHAVREALVLTSMLATADYDAWRDALVSTSELAVPPAVDLDSPSRRLQPQYRIALSRDSNYTWAHAKQLLASEERSARFQEHYAMVVETAGRHGIRLEDARHYPVCVDDCPGMLPRPLQLEWLQSVIDSIVALQEMGHEPSQGHTLRLISIDLTLQNCELHSSVFGKILELVETGVRITSLGMPSNFPDNFSGDRSARYEIWALLVCALCGQPQRPTRQPVCVEKLVLEAEYIFPAMLLPLFSVLRKARSLKSLRIATSSLQGPQGTFWLWLGATLFRPDSHSAVEVLALDMVSLTPIAIECLREAMKTSDPLALLWQKTTQTVGDASGLQTTSRREIVVPAGTSIGRYGNVPGGNRIPFTVPVDWSGVVVHDDSSKTTLGVLLFGIGFGEVDRALLPNKRQRVEPQAALRDVSVEHTNKVRALMLSLNADEDEISDDGAPPTICQVDTLLELVGDTLDALSICDLGMDDELLSSCLEKCPRLQSLRLDACPLTSMDPIIRSYERGGQISSLELSAIQVSKAFRPKFEAFLSALLIPSAMKRTLKKLRIGHQWASLFRLSTANVMKQVLDDPLTLDYLHLYRCENPRVAPTITWDVEKHDGRTIPVPGVPPLAVRVAFASVMRARYAWLDNNVVARVFEYVGRTKQRVVISEANSFYNSRMFAMR